MNKKYSSGSYFLESNYDIFINNSKLSEIIESTNNADIGPTIFNDKNHGFASAFMKASYGLLNTPIFIIEAFIKKINEG